MAKWNECLRLEEVLGSAVFAGREVLPPQAGQPLP